MSTGQIIIGAGLTTIYYPIAYAKVLIQIGHEPMPPRLSRTLFGGHAYMYPNVFKYIGHIYRTDGFFGLYRGLSFRVISSIISSSVSNSVQADLCGKPLNYDKNSDELDGDDAQPECDSISKLIKDTTYETISRCAGILCSQPFYVISIRCMAQFIGRETSYSSFTTAIPEIWKNEGIFGFFAGIVPRVVGEAVTIIIANGLTYFFNAIISNINEQSVESFRVQTGMIAQLIASQITYPFNVVSVVMAVNNCGLAAGSPPLAPVFENWLSCWKHLSDKNQIKRGSGLFWRRYQGPKIVSSGGMIMPPIEYQKYRT